MAQYKVLQDIEAEDKLLGPLSLRQFIYAVITIAFGFVAFRLFTSPLWFIGIVFVPPAIFFGLLAAPLGGQQSSEIWLLAKIRFFLKPKRRIWDQTGAQDLVTITVPKKIDKDLTKGYSQDEVKSRLKTLAATLDTRGWAVKNATSNPYAYNQDGSDRLLAISEEVVPQASTAVDMLDVAASPRAQAMDQMMNQSAARHRQEILNNMRKNQPAAQSTMPQPRPATAQKISPQDEAKILNKLHHDTNANHLSTAHLKTLQPARPAAASAQKQIDKPVTAPPDPAILNLVENSEDLSVETIAHQAKRIKDQGPDDEVVISLH